MLLIGDIHMTARQKEPILKELREFIAAHPDEKHILFMGDYVYHFSYERRTLLALFSFFVELYKEGKSVRVLAGNHDRIHEHFVFAEGKWSFDLLKHDTDSEGRLTFITEPRFETIEGDDVLFFPFTKLTARRAASEKFADLLNDEHEQVRQSGRANSLLEELVHERREQEKTSPKLRIVHHRYIANTTFPGQRTKFSFKSPALAASRLEQDDLLLISGHLHQPFCHKNYLCTGSVRSTSPLEADQIKYLFTCQQDRVTPRPVAINPYLSVAYTGEPITETTLQERWQEVVNESTEHLKGEVWKVDTSAKDVPLPLHVTTLYLHGGQISYEELTEILPDEVRHALHDVKIRQSQKALKTLLSSLEDSSMQLDERIADWKTLLRRYLEAKFGDQADAYEDILDELKIW